MSSLGATGISHGAGRRIDGLVEECINKECDEQSGMTTLEICRHTQLSWSSVSTAITDLIRAKRIRVLGYEGHRGYGQQARIYTRLRP